MSWIEAIAVTLAALVFMEGWAWFAHKYIMHGWGWGWHRDHHEPHDNVLEKNDLFAVVFGTINAARAVSGARNEPSPETRIIGMAKPTAPLTTPATSATPSASANNPGPRPTVTASMPSSRPGYSAPVPGPHRKVGCDTFIRGDERV